MQQTETVRQLRRDGVRDTPIPAWYQRADQSGEKVLKYHGDAYGQVNARYGNDPGVTFYTHVSDRYAPFYTKLINATVRDATHVLDGLLYHESELQIAEHYTDTAGFTDHVFALCHLLGFRFAPRLRHLAETRLFSVAKPSSYPALEKLIGGTVNTNRSGTPFT